MAVGKAGAVTMDKAEGAQGWGGWLCREGRKGLRDREEDVRQECTCTFVQ